jgi:predicted Zn-dependent protease
MNDRDPRRSAWLAAALAALLVAGACAINPATGKRQLVLIGEGQEIAMGLEADRSIQAEMGVYDDEALQAWVSGLARELAAKSERPQLDWTFRVVDDPVVNAFALPGGYIYVTRGILAHFLNEAELAGVLGHEIGHVTARHGVSQMSKAQLAQLGLGLGTILAPNAAQSLGGLAETGLGLLFLKYGRDDERQADELGLRYMVRVGYDPRPMTQVFDMLDRVSQAAGGERVPGWMSTHPAPDNRKQLMGEQIETLGAESLTDRGRDREDYLRRIDGIVFGDDPRQGYFWKERFLHPEMRFEMQFPAGWTLRNDRSAVLGVSPSEDAVVALTLTGATSAEDALREFFAQEGIVRDGSGFRATTAQGELAGHVAFVEHRERVFRLLGYAAAAGFPTHARAIRAAIESFAELDDPEALAVEPRRLRIVQPARAMTLEELARTFEATVPVETLALLNRLDPGERLQPGTSYKIVSGGPP